MKIGIKTNLKRDINALASKLFCQKLREVGIEYKICDNAKEYFESQVIAEEKEVFEWCDIVVAFGGDGTMLNIVHSLPCELPILGINMGKIGFLTEIDENQIADAISALQSGNYTVEQRSMLKATVDKQHFFALNEVVVSRQDPCHISVFDVYIDGILADTLRSDGVLVSTPTGSTAYSLSCNGPVLSPTVKALIVNGICPHSLHSCPIVVDDNMRINISTKTDIMRVIVDGTIVAKSQNDGIDITIEKDKKQALFVRLNNQNFYAKLRAKLNYWGD
ncbi:MAG: NAD(+)/NADH kinase [Clostridia bacterium]|nr:NAD(+)/NADH kinase [Clostridia bacterium]